MREILRKMTNRLSKVDWMDLLEVLPVGISAYLFTLVIIFILKLVNDCDSYNKIENNLRNIVSKPVNALDTVAQAQPNLAKGQRAGVVRQDRSQER